jgi:hypothetical protein
MGLGPDNKEQGQAFALTPEKLNRETASHTELLSITWNIHVILNGAQRSEESLRLKKRDSSQRSE